jgi:hypothetical protein
VYLELGKKILSGVQALDFSNKHTEWPFAAHSSKSEKYPSSSASVRVKELSKPLWVLVVILLHVKIIHESKQRISS